MDHIICHLLKLTSLNQHNAFEFIDVAISEVKVAQSCLTLCDPMGWLYIPWNSPGQNTRILQWVVHSPGDFPNPRIEPKSPTLQADSLPAESPGNTNSFFFLLVPSQGKDHATLYKELGFFPDCQVILSEVWYNLKYISTFFFQIHTSTLVEYRQEWEEKKKKTRLEL